MRGKARRKKAPTSPKMPSTRFARGRSTATGVVAAITMFLAREPLIDLAGTSSTGSARNERLAKARKAKVKQDKYGES